MSRELLSLENVTFSYAGSPPILSNISMEISKNELILIHGESGVGKSTFLKLFNRFHDCSKGLIYFHKKKLSDYRIEELRRSLIYLPQLPFMIDGSVQENLSFPFSFSANSEKVFHTHKAEAWLDYFQLNISLSHDALKLSIGQKQRIALIRSILLEPEVLLLDEPSSALDNKNKILIEQKIEHLIDSSDIAVLMATHSEVSFSEEKYRSFLIKDNSLEEVNTK